MTDERGVQSDSVVCLKSVIALKFGSRIVENTRRSSSEMRDTISWVLLIKI